MDGMTTGCGGRKSNSGEVEEGLKKNHAGMSKCISGANDKSE